MLLNNIAASVSHNIGHCKYSFHKLFVLHMSVHCMRHTKSTGCDTLVCVTRYYNVRSLEPTVRLHADADHARCRCVLYTRLCFCAIQTDRRINRGRQHFSNRKHFMMAYCKIIKLKSAHRIHHANPHKSERRRTPSIRPAVSLGWSPNPVNIVDLSFTRGVLKAPLPSRSIRRRRMWS